MGRIREAGVVEGDELEVVERDDVPAHYAAIGRQRGDRESVVTFSPERAGDALLAALAEATPAQGEPAFAGEVVVVAPQWRSSDRVRLGLVSSSLKLRAVSVSSLAEGPVEVEPDPPMPPMALPPRRVVVQIPSPDDRDLFQRAASALEGLASKHGGALRGSGRSVELVLMARRVAVLRADDGVVLETLEPQRSVATLGDGELAGALDKLEGQLRRRLNDRRAREGEEGLRARAVPLLASARSLRAVIPWPLGGSDRDVLDLAGVDGAGAPVVGAVRQSLTLPDLGEILDAVHQIQAALPLLLADADVPARLDAPHLLIAAEGYTQAAARALTSLGLAHELFQIRNGFARGIELVSIESGEASLVEARTERGQSARSRGRGRPQEERSDRGERPERGERGEREESDAQEAEGNDAQGSRRRRSRRRGGRGRSGAARSDEERADRPLAGGEADGDKNQAEPDAASPPRFDEVSLFDLDDERDGDDGDGSRRRRRGGRSRRRGRRGGSEDEGRGARGDSSDAEAATATAGSGDDVERSEPEPAGEDGDDALDFEDASDLLSKDVDDDFPGEPEPAYEEDDDDDGETSSRGRHRERKQVAPAPEESAPEERRAPRRRAAILACADRDSILAAVLLARDLRLVEGLWVYPQDEFMTFFRSVTTDLREDTPIHVVGFTPSPAGAVLQSAQLYRDRLHWYDWHDWPPEDLDALRSVLGEDQLHLCPGAGSSLPAVLSLSTRRSRFSDKLVDLAAGRFTQHDYERWGRLWWWRLGEVASKVGAQRSEVEALLAGRPSDLAREAARVDPPPVPEEVAFVSSRDFRLVHFADHSLVVLEVPDAYDLHLAARIARERYDAGFSLALREGGELAVLAGDDGAGRRTLDFGALVAHLAQKLRFVSALADTDHVARFRIEGCAEHPERLEDVIGEIAMGRSILEG